MLEVGLTNGLSATMVEAQYTTVDYPARLQILAGWPRPDANPVGANQSGL